MADVQDTSALLARLDSLEAQLAAQGEMIANTPTAETPAKASKKITLKGETFKVGGIKYRLKFPVIHHGGKNYTEDEVLESPTLQKELVEGGFGVIEKAVMILLMLFAFTFSAQATSVTINPYSVEVLTTTKRDLYPLQEMLIIYRASTDAFEVQTAETRSKVWGGDIDSVTISGASTTAAKLAYLRTLMLESTTTGGYRVFMGRSNLEFNYNTVSKRLDVKYGKNKQPLWFGVADSLQSGPSGAANKIAYLRLLNRWAAQDVLPTTSVATIAAGAAAGSSPTVAVSGDAFSGTITVTTGTSATTGTLATVTLNAKAPNGWRVIVKATGDNSILHELRVKASATTTTLVLAVPTTALSNSTAYTFDYWTIPY